MPVFLYLFLTPPPSCHLYHCLSTLLSLSHCFSPLPPRQLGTSGVGAVRLRMNAIHPFLGSYKLCFLAKASHTPEFTWEHHLLPFRWNSSEKAYLRLEKTKIHATSTDFINPHKICFTNKQEILALCNRKDQTRWLWRAFLTSNCDNTDASEF